MIRRFRNYIAKPLFKRYLTFRSSIYSRVVLVIAFMSVFLFLAFGLIFRSVYGEYLKTVIQQNGNNVGSIVEGALYHSMLENDKGELQNTLDIINNMSGIDEVNVYDEFNNLKYTSYTNAEGTHDNPNCIICHTDFNEMFPSQQRSYRIIDLESDCEMNQSGMNHRQLMIHTPILNQPSCYTSNCHAHSKDDVVLGSLLIRAPLDQLDNAVSKSTAEFFILSISATFLLVVFIILFTKRRIQRPLSELIYASAAVAKGDRTVRIDVVPYQLDDIKMVSMAFNNMMDNLQAATEELENWSQQLEYKVQKKSEELKAAQNEMIHIERIASLGKLSASVAHELNNPLSGILVYSKLVSKQLNSDQFSNEKKQAALKHLKFIENETKRCGDIVKGLLDFSKKDQDDFESKSLNDIVKDTCKIVNHSIKIANINFMKDLDAGHDTIHCNPGQIKQACVAILVNATEAITESGEIVVRTYNEDEGHISLEVADNGVGISEENMKKVFEPFFSTKHETSGIGLGLAIVHGIIQSHNGKIDIKSELGKGTAFKVVFPLVKN